ncbi:MAG: glycosyltransferase [Actinomycetota bacterium]
MTGLPQARIAIISLHTSPFDQPGSGDSGGMNVEIRALAGLLGRRGVATDIFTRAGREPAVEEVGPLTRVISAPASEFGPYDLVHSHYWRSGHVGTELARSWDVPLVASYHTLAEVKNLSLAPGDLPEPLARVAGERRTIKAADRLMAPTEDHARHLIELYDADPARIRVVPPGVDTLRFYPRDAEEARARLGLGAGPVVLFLGRLQPLKGPDLALRAFAEALRGAQDVMRDATLVIVGGPSGAASASIRPWLEDVAHGEGVHDRVRFVPPQPHEDLPWIYSAADVLLMPSRSESFGLAALESQACGTPVIASSVGGLRYAVADGVGGYLVEGRDPSSYAGRILEILTAESDDLSRGAVGHASTLPWELAVDRLLSVYGELTPALASEAAS